MKRIGIDARFFGTGGKGLGRYTQKLIQNLEKVDRENQYVIFLRKENFDEYSPNAKNFQKILADYKWYGFSEQIFFPLLLLRHRLDLVHFPHFNVPILYRKKIVVTIHDLILIHFPTVKNTTLNPLFYWLKFLAYKLSINSAIRRSEKIITVSNFTKEDILENYNIKQDRILVTHESSENFCFCHPGKEKNILEKYGIMKPYFLYVGNAYPHKNLELLAEAFGESNVKGGFDLALVGKDDYFYGQLKKFVVEKSIKGIVFPGFVPDHELDELYRNAFAYVFPSLYEGFGLPSLEAMSKGVPVISSNHACMQEILGDSALFFDARDRDEIVRAMKKIAQDSKLRSDLKKRGYKNAARFSWQEMAKKTLGIYENIMKKGV